MNWANVTLAWYKTPELWTARFKAGDIEYEVNLSGTNAIAIGLLALIDKGDHKEMLQGITKTGNAPLIFSTIIKIVEEFISIRKPDGFGFSSLKKYPSRIKLYKKLGAALSRKLPEYTLTIDDEPNRKAVDFSFDKNLTESVLTELRKNPEINKKSSALEQLEKYRGRKDVYASYTTDVGKKSHENIRPKWDSWETKDGKVFKNDVKSRNTQGAKLGINPQSSWDTPIGVYSYPVDYVLEKNGEIEFAGSEPFIHVFQETGKMLDLSEYSQSDMKDDIDKIYAILKNLGLKIGHNIPDFNPTRIADRALVQTYGGQIWNITRVAAFFMENIINDAQEKGSNGHVNPYNGDDDDNYDYYNGDDDYDYNYDDGETEYYNDYKAETDESSHPTGSIITEAAVKTHHPVQWSKLFRLLGYDGAVDRDWGIIHANEPTQAVFFSIKGIKPLETIRNISPMPSDSYYSLVMKAPEHFLKFVKTGKLTGEEIVAFLKRHPYIGLTWDIMTEGQRAYFKEHYISVILGNIPLFSIIPLTPEEIIELFKAASKEQVMDLVEDGPSARYGIIPEVRQIIIQTLALVPYPLRPENALCGIPFTEDEVIQGLQLVPSYYALFKYCITTMPNALIHLFEHQPLERFMGIYFSIPIDIKKKIMTRPRIATFTNWLISKGEQAYQFDYKTADFLRQLLLEQPMGFKWAVQSVNELNLVNFICRAYNYFDTKVAEDIFLVRPELIKVFEGMADSMGKNFFSRFKNVFSRVNHANGIES